MLELPDDKVLAHAFNPENPTSDHVPHFPTGQLSQECKDAALKKGLKRWKLAEVDHRNVPRNGTLVHLMFSHTITDSGMTWHLDWYRVDA